MNVEEAKKALDEEARSRAEECSKEMATLLEKHRCTFDVAAVLKQGKNPEFIVSIVPQ